jgi:hypothetical protein
MSKNLSIGRSGRLVLLWLLSKIDKSTQSSTTSAAERSKSSRVIRFTRHGYRVESRELGNGGRGRMNNTIFIWFVRMIRWGNNNISCNEILLCLLLSNSPFDPWSRP